MLAMLCSQLWKPDPPPKTPNTSDDVKLHHQELTLGVWRVLLIKDSHFFMSNFGWEVLSTNFPLFCRALYDLYTISPRLFLLSVIEHLWFAIEGPISLYVSNMLFYSMEKKLSGDLANNHISSDLCLAMISGTACSMFNAYMNWSSEQTERAYASRIKYEYEARAFSAKLAWDLPTSQGIAVSDPDVNNVYQFLKRGLSIVTQVISFLLHLRLIAHIIGTGYTDGGPIFLALCIVPPVMRQFISDDLWTKAYVTNAINKFYIRKYTLDRLADTGLKQEVMAGGVANFLRNEYRKAKDGLGDTTDSGPEVLYAQQHQTKSDVVTALSSEAQKLYFVFLGLFNPSKLSIIQLSVLNSTSTSLCYTFESIRFAISLWPCEFARMRNVYTMLETKNEMKDGHMPFPRPGYEASAGMGIELRDVSFSYPKTHSERPSLKDVSFTIQPGQLVVIVGGNGSGKSTVMKLLSRFYSTTSGSILIDGIPIEEYGMDTLRKGIAMLTQEHQLFPLSVEENIKLGTSEVDAMDDQKKIEASVVAAGAVDLVKNFKEGYDTVLEPLSTGYVSYAGQGITELETIQKDLEKPTDISGGERQKLVAARTFMRLFTSSVKLVTVDEPSSALDPEAEYQLFANLRQERQGRTMIFVTHRFGHLTKYADMIICMKDGAVVETGTHADLLSKDGEYAHLYNIQARAFATT